MSKLDPDTPRTESVWKLLHEEEPVNGDECYYGFLGYHNVVWLRFGIWEVGDWFLNGSRRHWAFGSFSPLSLPMKIYWCYKTDFPNDVSAEKSLQSLLAE